MIPFIDLTRQHAGLRTELLAAMARVLDRSQFILGDEGRALEHEVAVACGVRRSKRVPTLAVTTGRVTSTSVVPAWKTPCSTL